MRKRMILSLVMATTVLCCLHGITVKAYLGVLYWYSDRNEVAMWLHSPTYSLTMLNGDAGFNYYFTESAEYAKNQWQPVTTSIIKTYASSSANIPCYGGTKTELTNATGSTVEEGMLGVVFGGQDPFTYISYNGTTKGLMTQRSPQKLCIVKFTGLSHGLCRRVFMHELGHAMGWLGHASGVNDIMGLGANGQLSNADKLQLSQVYSFWN